jgi:ABC transporter substrate binding protein
VRHTVNITNLRLLLSLKKKWPELSADFGGKLPGEDNSTRYLAAFARGAERADATARHTYGIFGGHSEASSPSRRLYLGLTQSGWREGENIRIEQRWTGANIDLTRRFANELVAFQPDVLFASTTPVTGALARETRKIPIVFTVVSDPIGAGLVISLSRPGGNITLSIDPYVCSTLPSDLTSR